MTRTPTPTATPNPTTISTTRYTIDRFNLTFALQSDAALVSVGALPLFFGDAVGSLVATAVLIKSCANPPDFPDLIYRPSRIDLLMSSRDLQPGRAGISDFFVTLYADDGSDEHNPSVQVCRPLIGDGKCPPSVYLALPSPLPQLAPPTAMPGQTGPLITTRGAWYQQDVSGAGWPNLNASTYYWIVLSPGVPLALASQGGALYNGARWVGVDETVAPLAAATLADPHLFKGRQLVSQRFSNDVTFQANAPTAPAWLRSQTYWPSVANAAARFIDWDAVGSRVRYGVQLLGWQIAPTPSFTPSGIPGSP